MCNPGHKSPKGRKLVSLNELLRRRLLSRSNAALASAASPA